MRNFALLAALMVVVALPTTSNAAAKKEDPAMAAQRDSSNFMRDAMNPYEATKPSTAKVGKHKKK